MLDVVVHLHDQIEITGVPAEKLRCTHMTRRGRAAVKPFLARVLVHGSRRTAECMRKTAETWWSLER